jgi:hypothetical protein
MSDFPFDAVGFDLDGTLIPLGKPGFPVERQSAMLKALKLEPLRVGTVNLFKKLKEAGHEVGIYTTSFRSQRLIRVWLWSYGIKTDFVINEQLAGPVLRQSQINCSKYPPAFDIDLHIDDQPGVALEGERYGFETLLVQPEMQNIESLFSSISQSCQMVTTL